MIELDTGLASYSLHLKGCESLGDYYSNQGIPTQFEEQIGKSLDNEYNSRRHRFQGRVCAIEAKLVNLGVNLSSFGLIGIENTGLSFDLEFESEKERIELRTPYTNELKRFSTRANTLINSQNMEKIKEELEKKLLDINRFLVYRVKEGDILRKVEFRNSVTETKQSFPLPKYGEDENHTIGFSYIGEDLESILKSIINEAY